MLHMHSDVRIWKYVHTQQPQGCVLHAILLRRCSMRRYIVYDDHLTLYHYKSRTTVSATSLTTMTPLLRRLCLFALFMLFAPYVCTLLPHIGGVHQSMQYLNPTELYPRPGPGWPGCIASLTSICRRMKLQQYQKYTTSCSIPLHSISSVLIITDDAAASQNLRVRPRSSTPQLRRGGLQGRPVGYVSASSDVSPGHCQSGADPVPNAPVSNGYWQSIN